MNEKFNFMHEYKNFFKFLDNKFNALKIIQYFDRLRLYTEKIYKKLWTIITCKNIQTRRMQRNLVDMLSHHKTKVG